jgi:hypothetical protein
VRGYGAMLVVAGIHFFALRFLVLGSEPRAIAQGSWLSWGKNLAVVVVAAVVPVDMEILAFRPILWGALALALGSALVLLAVIRRGALPLMVPAGAAIFLVLAAPAVIGLQERYLFLAVAASSIALAALLRAVGGRPAAVGWTLVLAGSIAGCAAQWSYWRQAALASESLVGDLAAASADGGVEEIVVANMPFRVCGGAVYVYGDFRSALRLSGGRDVPVKAAVFIAYPDARADALEGALPEDPSFSATSVDVRLRIPSMPFSRYCGPGDARRPGTFSTPQGRVTLDGSGGVRIELARGVRPGRPVYVWSGGGLRRLF